MGRRKAQARRTGVRVPSTVESVLDSALDRALSIQRPAVTAYLDRLRTKRPNATPAEIIEVLERRYFTTVVGLGGASGAAAALPGFGTAATVASGAAELTAFIGATAMFTLAQAELHSVPVSDPEVRRALVVAVLLGDAGAAVLAGEEESRHWAQLLGRSMATERIGDVNGRLGQLLITRFGVRHGAVLFGRAIPLGIGAGVGAVANAALARTAIASARRAFGPAPTRFPGRVIDA